MADPVAVRAVVEPIARALEAAIEALDAASTSRVERVRAIAMLDALGTALTGARRRLAELEAADRG